MLRKTALFLIFFATATIAAHTETMAGDQVSVFDVDKTCQADVRADPSGGSVAGCLAQEKRAHEALTSQWTQFSPKSRAACLQTAIDIGGLASYVGLLTCLQMAKDVRTLPKGSDNQKAGGVVHITTDDGSHADKLC